MLAATLLAGAAPAPRPLAAQDPASDRASGVQPVPALPDSALHAPARPDSAAERERDGPYFFHDRPYGSDLYMGPLDPLLNRGFSVAQMENRDPSIFDYPYGVEHVWNSLVHPVRAVERAGGWRRVAETELFPGVWLPKEEWRWYPNYVDHLLAGGVVTRKLREWYEARGVPYASFLAGATFMASSVLNEMYEYPGGTEERVATTVDLYVFDLGGVLLFMNDGVSRFFAHTLRAQVWPQQGSILLPHGEVVNNGDQIVFKFPISPIPRTSLYFRSGVSGHVGLTLHMADSIDVSVGAGMDGSRQYIDAATGEESVDLAYSAGVFVDRAGSLLFSATASQLWRRMITVNLYPGLIGIGGTTFGAWLTVTRDREVMIGLSHRYLLGTGFGASLGR